MRSAAFSLTPFPVNDPGLWKLKLNCRHRNGTTTGI